MELDKKNIDIIEMIMFPLIAATISYGLQLNFFFSIILFFGLPSIYLSIRHPKFVKKSLIFSSLTSIPLVIMIDFPAHITKQWVVPNTIFPMRIFGEVPFEDIILAFLQFYMVVIYYQNFLENHYSKTILPKKLAPLLIAILIAMVIFMLNYIFYPQNFYINYFYLLVCIITLLLVARELIKFPKLRLKLLKSAVYFFYITFVYEIVGQVMKWWIFPNSHMVGWISFFQISFPLEELIFWITLSSLAVITLFQNYEEGTA